MERGVDESNQRISVIIADDLLPIREYFKMVLSREADLKVIDAVGSVAEAVNRVLDARPNVLLIDPGMETPRTGLEAIKTIVSFAPSVRLIILTYFSDDEEIFSAFDAGASEYVSKNSSTGETIEAIRMAVNDTFPLRSRIFRMIRAELGVLEKESNVLKATLSIVFHLSPKELGILRLLVIGKDENEITGLQWVESLIVKSYVVNMLKKFDESSVTDLVYRLVQLGISGIFTNEKVESLIS